MEVARNYCTRHQHTFEQRRRFGRHCDRNCKRPVSHHSDQFNRFDALLFQARYRHDLSLYRQLRQCLASTALAWWSTYQLGQSSRQARRHQRCQRHAGHVQRSPALYLCQRYCTGHDHWRGRQQLFRRHGESCDLGKQCRQRRRSSYSDYRLGQWLLAASEHILPPG